LASVLVHTLQVSSSKVLGCDCGQQITLTTAFTIERKQPSSSVEADREQVNSKQITKVKAADL
jgi:hypothetical protein